MAANTNPIFPDTLDGGTQSFVNADSTSSKTLYTAPSDGARIDGISATSDDTSDVVFKVIINDGSNDRQVGEVTVSAGAGTNGTVKAKKVLNSTDLPWLDDSGSVFLKGGWALKLAAKTAVTSAKTVSFVAFAGAY